MTPEEIVLFVDQLSREEIKQLLGMCIYQLDDPGNGADIKEVLDVQIKQGLKEELVALWIKM